MNAPDFSAVLADIRSENVAEAQRLNAKRIESERLLKDCRKVGEKGSRHEAFALAARFLLLPQLTACEVLLFSTVLAQKVRNSGVEFASDAADAIESELPNIYWAVGEDNPDNYPEAL